MEFNDDKYKLQYSFPPLIFFKFIATNKSLAYLAEIRPCVKWVVRKQNTLKVEAHILVILTSDYFNLLDQGACLPTHELRSGH